MTFDIDSPFSVVMPLYFQSFEPILVGKKNEKSQSQKNIIVEKFQSIAEVLIRGFSHINMSFSYLFSCLLLMHIVELVDWCVNIERT